MADMEPRPTNEIVKTPSTEPTLDDSRRLAEIARILGVADPYDTTAITSAFNALVKPHAARRANALRTLSARERSLCSEKRIDPVRYAATRAAIRARST